MLKKIPPKKVLPFSVSFIVRFLHLHLFNTINAKQILLFVTVFIRLVTVWLVGLANTASCRNKERRSSGKDVDGALRDDAGAANVTVRAKQAQGDHAGG